MRTGIFLLILCGFFSACNQNSATDHPGSTSDEKIRKQVISIAETYVINQLKNGVKKVSGNGVITVSDSLKRYIIDPSKIYIGLIDDDQDKDAIVTLVSFRGQYLDLIEHLIIIKSDSKFMMIKAVESDMKILKLKDRVITAELHTRPRTSPLYNCSSCREIVNYRYKGGDLIRIE